MRKTALTMTVTTLVLSVFGAFLHWLQRMNAFDGITGFPVPGARTTLAFLAYTVLAIVAFCFLALFWTRRRSGSRDAEEALRSATVLPRVFGWVLCVCFAVAACLVLFRAEGSAFPTLRRLFGAAGIAAAVAFPFLFAKKDGAAGAAGKSAAVVLTLFYCFWMVVCYKNNSTDPITWHYAIEILAVVGCAVAVYLVTEFFFGAGKPAATLIAMQIAVYFGVASLFEQRELALNVMLGAGAAALLALEYLLYANLRE